MCAVVSIVADLVPCGKLRWHLAASLVLQLGVAAGVGLFGFSCDVEVALVPCLCWYTDIDQ